MAESCMDHLGTGWLQAFVGLGFWLGMGMDVHLGITKTLHAEWSHSVEVKVMSTVIHARNVSKQYRLGQIGTGTLSHDLNRWWHTIRGKEDPYLRIGEKNHRDAAGKSAYVWALKDVSFDIGNGEVLGIIGRNGAGKSTLLKILSRTTSPSSGEINIKGRIASLLEVGTGFHPELTGRENIYLNGAILGMTRREITKKFEEIVDFSGVERYIDTPVKRYSSGMYVRLAFGVAANLESEILIIDEVLAVGDAEFQQKCLGKMSNISTIEGRTVLFVSHNMSSMNSLCRKGIVMKQGEIMFTGDMSDAISAYMMENDARNDTPIIHGISFQNEEILIESLSLRNAARELSNSFMSDENIYLEIRYSIRKRQKNFRIILSVKTHDAVHILETSDVRMFRNSEREEGEYVSRLIIPGNFFNLGRYTIELIVDKPNEEKLFGPVSLQFVITDLMESQIGVLMGKPMGVIHPKLEWQVLKREGCVEL